MSSETPEVHTSMCRLCLASCGIRVTVDEGRVIHVAGDRDNPLSRGFTCAKGRSLPDQLNHPERLLRTVVRRPDGDFAPISVVDAVDDIAERLRRLLEEYGPRSIALYYGTGSAAYPAVVEIGRAFLRAIGSPMGFSPSTIDQPGKQIATSMHGRWGGLAYSLAQADVWMFVGTNPIVSMWGGMTVTDPLRRLQEQVRRGLRIVTVDPRRTEVASLSEVHLQTRPGQDVAVLAGLLRLVLTSGRHDTAFCSEHVAGVEALVEAVAPFDVERVERLSGVPGAELVSAAEVLLSSRKGGISAGTGANMTMFGTLTEYLLLDLHTICGFWPREGEVVANPGVLIEPTEFRAEAQSSAAPLWGAEEMRSRPLRQTSAGMPTAALADEILFEGPERVRALLCMGGNPIAAWPDQLHTERAMRALDLLVCFDVRLSATARLADYIVGTKFMLEVPMVTGAERSLRSYGATSGLFPVPYAMYSPAIVDPPLGSEVVEEWEVLLAVAARLGLTLDLYGTTIGPGEQVTTVELYERIYRGTRIALQEVRRHQHGGVFEPRTPIVVGPRGPGHSNRLRVAEPLMLAQLAGLAASPALPRDETFPFLLTCRRMREAKNSSGLDVEVLRRKHRTNPAFLNPADLARLGLREGDAVVIRSARAEIPALVAEDEGVLPGTVSMAHAWGDLPYRDDEFREIGATTGRLVNNHADFDPISGMPTMTALPVAVIARFSS